jgi:hypothetical protein
MRKAIVFVLGLVLLASVPALAESIPVELATGTYVTQGGWGDLTISRGNSGQHFTIDVVGTNYHMCNLEGSLVGTIGTVDTSDGGDACTIELTPTPQGITITAQDGDGVASGCRSYCGARAYFEGEYFATLPICTPSLLNSHISMLAVLPRAEELAYAQAEIMPALEKCTATLRPSTEQDLRGALALAYYHAGEPEKCRATLAVYQEWLAKSDAEIREEKSYAPSEADEALAQSKQLRNISELCKAN